MIPTDALARAEGLLAEGFVMSAANVLVDDAREAAVSRLQELREAVRQGPPAGSAVPEPAPAKKSGRKKGA